MSARCTLDRKETREACAKVARLGEEAERSREYQRLLSEMKTLRTTDRVRVVKGSGDAQLDTMEALTHLTWLKPSRTTLEAGLAAQKVVAKDAVGPDAELSPAPGFDAATDRDDDIKAVQHYGSVEARAASAGEFA